MTNAGDIITAEIERRQAAAVEALEKAGFKVRYASVASNQGGESHDLVLRISLSEMREDAEGA